MTLIEAHIIIYGLVAISIVALTIAFVYLVLRTIDMHRYVKASNAVIHMQLKYMKSEDRKNRKEFESWK